MIGAWTNRRLLRFVVALSGAAALLGFLAFLVQLTGGGQVDALARRVDAIESRLDRAAKGTKRRDVATLLAELDALVSVLGDSTDADGADAPPESERVARVQSALRSRLAALRDAIESSAPGP